MKNEFEPLLDFRLPGLPPSVNSMYGVNKKTKKLYKVDKARKWQIAVAKLFKGSRPKHDCLVALMLEFHIKDPAKHKRRDLDNFLKCTIDSLQLSGQIKNDKKIVFIAATKILDSKNFITGRLYNMENNNVFSQVCKTFGMYGSFGTS